MGAHPSQPGARPICAYPANSACPFRLDPGCWQVCCQLVLANLANAQSILGPTSEGGQPDEVCTALNNATEADWVFDAFGTVQAILGSVLLFTVPLSLRNRLTFG